MTGTLQGKVALISGAARGQGRSHAIRLAEEGADIIALDICADIPSIPYSMATPEDLAETERLVHDLDRRIVARQVDVRDFESLRSAVEDGISELGNIDIVCANAGIGAQVTGSQSWNISEERWRDTLDVNLTGSWHTVKAAIPSMIDGGRGGSIVMTGSTAAVKGMEQLSDYAASKHGVLGLMRSLAQELAPYNIRVNAVIPTGVNTPMIHNAAMDKFVAENPAMMANLSNMLPIPEVQPVDISNAIVWLCSDAARYVTAIALPIDAGFTQK